MHLIRWQDPNKYSYADALSSLFRLPELPLHVPPPINHPELVATEVNGRRLEIAASKLVNQKIGKSCNPQIPPIFYPHHQTRLVVMLEK